MLKEKKKIFLSVRNNELRRMLAKRSRTHLFISVDFRISKTFSFGIHTIVMSEQLWCGEGIVNLEASVGIPSSSFVQKDIGDTD